MASTPKSTIQEPPTIIRTLRVRLYPGTAAKGQYLEQLAGACRFAWNHVLAGHETDYRTWKASSKLGDGPGAPTFFTLGKQFTQLRNACKYLGDCLHRILQILKFGDRGNAWEAWSCIRGEVRKVQQTVELRRTLQIPGLDRCRPERHTTIHWV